MVVVTLMLDGRNRVMGDTEVSRGSVNASRLTPREDRQHPVGLDRARLPGRGLAEDEDDDGDGEGRGPPRAATGVG